MSDKADTMLSMDMGHYISNGVGELNTLWVSLALVMLEEMPESWGKELPHAVWQFPRQTTIVIVEAPEVSASSRWFKKEKSLVMTT